MTTNGATIRVIDGMSVTYWHVPLAQWAETDARARAELAHRKLNLIEWHRREKPKEAIDDEDRAR